MTQELSDESLVRIVADRYRWATKRGALDRDDLLQTGRAALVAARRSHDPAVSPWTAYARMSIRNALYDACLSAGPVRTNWYGLKTQGAPKRNRFEIADRCSDEESAWHVQLGLTCGADEPDPFLQQALNDLPARWRHVIVQRAHGCIHAEIADELGVSRWCVQQIERKALAQLREALT